MNVIVGLSYIFIGLVGLYQIWKVFMSFSIELEILRMKHTWVMLFVDILIGVLGALLFVISVFAILAGITTLIGGTL